MLYRVSAAACAAAVGIMLAAPAPSNARGGAAAMGHVGGLHPSIRSFHRVRPPFVHAHPPFAHARPVPLTRHDPVRREAFHAAERRHRRVVLGLWGFGGYWLPFTYADDGAFYGSYYDPSDVTGAIDPPPPAAVVPVAARDVPVLDRGGCRSETVALPSPDGAEHNVTITRC
jgi:hypothetical protein